MTINYIVEKEDKRSYLPRKIIDAHPLSKDILEPDYRKIKDVDYRKDIKDVDD